MTRGAVLFVGVSLVAGLGGTAMTLAAAVWVMTLTGSSALAALASFFVFAPSLVGPVLGALVDRAPVRPVLLTSNLVLAALLMTLSAVDEAADVWHIFAVMLAYGVSYVVVDAAEARLVVASVPRDALGTLNGFRLGTQEATKLVAPLVGAGLFVVAGGAAVAALTAGCLTIAAILYLFVPARLEAVPARLEAVQATDPVQATDAVQAGDAVQTGGRRRVWTDMVAGLRYVRTQPLLWWPVIVASLAMVASGVATAGLYGVVAEALHRPPAFLGVLSSIQGGAAIVAGLLVGWLMSRLKGEAPVALLGAGMFSLGCLAHATGWLPATLVGSALVGLGLPWAVVAALTAVQRHTPAAMMGTVTGSANMLVFAPPALGLPLGAALVSAVDYHVPMVLAIVLAVGVVVQVARRAVPLRPGLSSEAASS
ncbi:MAG: MFS transporter [Micromonosporaceae bacterium]|nr:MFS transporter [Micromonosporaceae bacterium]